jgi:hypothetical protein
MDLALEYRHVESSSVRIFPTRRKSHGIKKLAEALQTEAVKSKLVVDPSGQSGNTRLQLWKRIMI